MMPINRITYHLAEEEAHLDYIREENSADASSAILICRTAFEIGLLDEIYDDEEHRWIYMYAKIVKDMARKLLIEHSRTKLVKFLDELKAIKLPSIQYVKFEKYFSRAILREHVQLIHETTARIQLLDEQCEFMYVLLSDRESHISVLVQDVIDLIASKVCVGRVGYIVDYVDVTC